MKRARLSEEQIITILKEAEGGTKVTELCRRHGISDATFYTWRSKYEAQWLRPRNLSEWAEYWSNLRGRDNRTEDSTPTIPNGEAIYANGAGH